MQKSANRMQWSLLRLLRCSLFSTKIQYFFEEHDENINFFALGVLFL